MAGFVNQDVRLGRSRLSGRVATSGKTVPLSDLHVPLPDRAYISSLRRRLLASSGSSIVSVVDNRIIPYKLEPIHASMLLDKLFNVPVTHPLRYHCKAPAAHRHSQQWEHVWMAETSPRHDLLAKSLCNQN